MPAWNALTTDQRIDAIKTIYPETIGTARSIAEALTKQFDGTVSRSAIVSYYSRYPDKLKSAPLTGKLKAEAGTPLEPVAKKKIKRPSMLLVSTGTHFAAPKKASAPAAVDPVTVTIPVPDPLLLRLFELERNHCKWPVAGDRENTLFCGADQVDNGPYCACHKAMSVGRGSRAERDAVPMRKAA